MSKGVRTVSPWMNLSARQDLRPSELHVYLRGFDFDSSGHSGKLNAITDTELTEPQCPSIVLNDRGGSDNNPGRDVAHSSRCRTSGKR